MPNSLIRVLEIIQPSHSLMRAADFILFEGGKCWLCMECMEMLLSDYVGWEVQQEGGANDEEGWRRIDGLLRR